MQSSVPQSFRKETTDALISLSHLVHSNPSVSLAEVSKYFERLRTDPLINVILIDPTNTEVLGAIDILIRNTPALNMSHKRLLTAMGSVRVSLNQLGVSSADPKCIHVKVQSMPPSSTLTPESLKTWANKLVNEETEEIYANTHANPLNPNIRITDQDVSQLVNMQYQLDRANARAHETFNMAYKSILNIHQDQK